jgi:hypothetical protein
MQVALRQDVAQQHGVGDLLDPVVRGVPVALFLEPEDLVVEARVRLAQDLRKAFRGRRIDIADVGFVHALVRAHRIRPGQAQAQHQDENAAPPRPAANGWNLTEMSFHAQRPCRAPSNPRPAVSATLGAK